MAICEHCGTERQTLHRHRKTPGVEGGQYEDGNIEMICGNCHEDEHGGPFGGVLRGRLSDSPESKAKKSSAMKAKWEDPEYRSRVVEAQKEGWKDPDRREAHSAATRRWYAENPDKVLDRNRKIAASRKGKHYPKLAEAQKRRAARRREDLSYIPVSRDEFVAAVEELGSMRKVAAHFGIGYGTACNWRDAFAVKAKSPGRSATKRPARGTLVAALERNSWNLRKTGLEFDASHGSVRNWIKHYGIER